MDYEQQQIKAMPLIATKYGGRTIAGIKGQDEEHMWKPGSELWGQKIEARRIKLMDGDSAEDLDRFLGDCGVSFASAEASEQYDAFMEGRLSPAG
jgi:hypothetical protein